MVALHHQEVPLLATTFFGSGTTQPTPEAASIVTTRKNFQVRCIFILPQKVSRLINAA